MKIVIINHSDTKGGASVVSYRLMEALRALGQDAVMLVAHKGSDNPAVHTVGPKWRLEASFMAEHMRILLGNGLNRADMFKVSLGSNGLPLSRHPLVRNADAVFLNWVNQGMLSLREVTRIAARKTVVWTMHDMWNITGICHHAATCRRYTTMPGCGFCPLLHSGAGRRDLSRRTWGRKVETYLRGHISFVAVSSWLAARSAESTLMRGQHVSLIPNAFPTEYFTTDARTARRAIGLPEGKKLIVMCAARLDDPVKGLDMAVDVLNRVADADAHAVLIGALRDPEALASLRMPHTWLGTVNDAAVMREIYAHSTAVISTSRYETLPGTLIEGQAAGCTPVAFDSGGQRDIITGSDEGFLIPPYDTAAFAAALDKALAEPLDRASLHEAVVRKFSATAVAKAYLDLIGGSSLQ